MNATDAAALALDSQTVAEIDRASELSRVIAAHLSRATSAAEERRAIWARLVDRGVPHKVLRDAAGVSQSLIVKELRIARHGRR